MTKILLVDGIQRIMKMLANRMGLEVVEASDGQQAVEYFSGGGTCDLVLMDKDMPIMDGHQATRQIRAMGVETPIIVLSGDDSQSNRHPFSQAGANEFLAKPLTQDKLREVLSRY